VSFVSVTQQFNTTTSMGRLTLNVLLSFAQFEREVTGERIRDKIAASKRKGMWMGGNLPLGYDVQHRQLVINDTEAETVRYIFRRYVELGTVSALQADLKQRGIVSKIWTSTTGKVRGGLGYSRGALYYLLRNQIYLGRIAHKRESHQGQHAAIVDQNLWDRVQAGLSTNGTGKGRPPTAASPSALAGFLYDDRGNLMSPTYTKKTNGRRYRYYVSQALLQNERANAGSVSRIPAEAIERLVDEEVRRLLPPPYRTEGPHSDRREEELPIREMVQRISVHPDKVEIELSKESARKLVVSGDANGLIDDQFPGKTFTVSARLTHRGRGGRLEGSERRLREESGRPDAALVKAICRAHEWLGRFEKGEVASYHELARTEGLTPGYVRGVMQLAFLAPEMVEAYLEGRRRLRGGVMELLSRSLLLSWREQHASM
jgi:site-specific DNA recombinase